MVGWGRSKRRGGGVVKGRSRGTEGEVQFFCTGVGVWSFSVWFKRLIMFFVVVVDIVMRVIYWRSVKRGGVMKGRRKRKGGVMKGRRKRKGGVMKGRSKKKGGAMEGRSKKTGGVTKGRSKKKGGVMRGGSKKRGGVMKGRSRKKGGLLKGKRSVSFSRLEYGELIYYVWYYRSALGRAGRSLCLLSLYSMAIGLQHVGVGGGEVY
jgi:hypothetical protein